MEHIGQYASFSVYYVLGQQPGCLSRVAIEQSQQNLLVIIKRSLYPVGIPRISHLKQGELTAQSSQKDDPGSLERPKSEREPAFTIRW